MQQDYKSSKRLHDIDNELERAIFLASYNSTKQRLRRKISALVLTIKHGLRGFLFSWPLYLLPLSAFALPGQYKYLFILFLLPGLYVSSLILKKGIVEDYAEFISERLLNDGYIKQLLFSKSRW